MVMKTGCRYDEPSHFKVRLENYSLFRTKIDRYESKAFEVASYKWKLVVYPNGRETRGAKGHVSMYLEMAEENILPKGWNVQVCFKMFVYDFKRDQYLTAEDDDRVWRFHDMKKEWGFDKVLSVNYIDAVKGYCSEDDACIFGVEIFVLKYEGKGESMKINEQNFMRNCESCQFEWTVPKFPELDGEPQYSDMFVTGGRKWKLSLYPKGNVTANNRTFSLYLNLVDWVFAPGQRTFVRYTLCRKKGDEGVNDSEHEGSFWFSSAATSQDVSDLISLDNLENPAKGFPWIDNTIIQVDFDTIMDVKDFSN